MHTAPSPPLCADATNFNKNPKAIYPLIYCESSFEGFLVWKGGTDEEQKDGEDWLKKEKTRKKERELVIIDSS